MLDRDRVMAEIALSRAAVQASRDFQKMRLERFAGSPIDKISDKNALFERMINSQDQDMIDSALVTLSEFMEPSDQVLGRVMGLLNTNDERLFMAVISALCNWHVRDPKRGLDLVLRDASQKSNNPHHISSIIDLFTGSLGSDPDDITKIINLVKFELHRRDS